MLYSAEVAVEPWQEGLELALYLPSQGEFLDVMQLDGATFLALEQVCSTGAQPVSPYPALTTNSDPDPDPDPDPGPGPDP
tara:strand:- start:182 stop:421 length:240 start_codon:yes stop_codon:yes gene_type:complete